MVEGDLVRMLAEDKIDFAVHQAKCVSKGAQGLALSLFKAFPTARGEGLLLGFRIMHTPNAHTQSNTSHIQANIYQHHATTNIPGTIKVTFKPGVVHLFDQYGPGPPSRGPSQHNCPTSCSLS